MIKLENQIYADLILLINKALQNFKVEGWKICQFVQPVKFTETEPVIYVSIDKISKRGAQYSRNRKENGKLIHQEIFREEINVKIFALRRNLIKDSSLTQTSDDVLKMIMSWLVSPAGLNEIYSSGYSIYNPSEIKPLNFKDDSQNTSSIPSFNITFIIEQSWDTSVEMISEYKLKMKGI